jgi:hypothetical protein
LTTAILFMLYSIPIAEFFGDMPFNHSISMRSAQDVNTPHIIYLLKQVYQRHWTHCCVLHQWGVCKYISVLCA